MYGYEGEWSIPLDAFNARVQFLTQPTADAMQVYNDTHDEVYRRIAVFGTDPSVETYTRLAEGVNTLNAKLWISG